MLQEIILHVAAGETLGIVRDSFNARNAAAPILVRGVGVLLRMRLFGGREDPAPYPIEKLRAISAWRWAMDSDFDEGTSVKLAADNAAIGVASIETEQDGETRSFTEVSIPIPDMNTAELAEWLGTERSRSGLHGELVGFDAQGRQAFVLQVEDFTVRNRIAGAGDPTELPDRYLDADGVRALAGGGFECAFSGDGESWHAAPAAGDALMRFRLAGSASALWSDPVPLPEGPAGPKGEKGEKGEKGDPGDGASVDLSSYATKTELRQAVSDTNGEIQYVESMLSMKADGSSTDMALMQKQDSLENLAGSAGQVLTRTSSGIAWQDAPAVGSSLGSSAQTAARAVQIADGASSIQAILSPLLATSSDDKIRSAAFVTFPDGNGSFAWTDDAFGKIGGVSPFRTYAALALDTKQIAETLREAFRIVACLFARSADAAPVASLACYAIRYVVRLKGFHASFRYRYSSDNPVTEVSEDWTLYDRPQVERTVVLRDAKYAPPGVSLDDLPAGSYMNGNEGPYYYTKNADGTSKWHYCNVFGTFRYDIEPLEAPTVTMDYEIVSAAALWHISYKPTDGVAPSPEDAELPALLLLDITNGPPEGAAV